MVLAVVGMTVGVVLFLRKETSAYKDGVLHPMFILGLLFMEFHMALNLRESVAKDFVSFAMNLMGVFSVVAIIGISYFRVWRKAPGADTKLVP
jgi:uncharacterized membrane protein YadS